MKYALTREEEERAADEKCCVGGWDAKGQPDVDHGTEGNETLLGNISVYQNPISAGSITTASTAISLKARNPPLILTSIFHPPQQLRHRQKENSAATTI